MKPVMPAAAGFLACLFLAACGGSPDIAEFETGGIYSVTRPDGTYGAVKLLQKEAGMVHLRLYVNRFPDRPREILPEDLKMQGGTTGMEMGIDHIPMPTKGFQKWGPQLLTTTEVTEQELSTYRQWKQSGG